jgi:putative SOS response-associated peptidase YedK
MSPTAANDVKSDLGPSDGHGPGRPGLVLRRHPQTGERHLDQLVWGLLPHDTGDPASAPRPIHARAETVATQPLFADAFRRRRAIVPATEYFQRQTQGDAAQRFAISRADGRPMAFAGLWEAFRYPDGRITRTYCVITVEANALLAPIHDRMPLVLEDGDWPVWLGEQPGDPAALLRPPASDVLQCRLIGGRRGKSKGDPSPGRPSG